MVFIKASRKILTFSGATPGGAIIGWLKSPLAKTKGTKRRASAVVLWSSMSSVSVGASGRRASRARPVCITIRTKLFLRQL